MAILRRMKCEHCGAPARDEGAFCSHCGGRFKRPTGTPGHLAVVAPARFFEAEAHTSYPLALAHTPAERPIGEVGGPIGGIAMGVLILIYTFVQLGSIGPFVYVMALVPVGIVVWSIVMLVIALGQRDAPIEKALRVVVDERSDVVGGKHKRSVYFATLQDRDGARVEYDCEDWLAARIANGDIGVAFIQAGRILDFVRIEV